MNDIIFYILSALAAIIILTVHEYSHGYAAHKLGDDTASVLGRLTLNPIKHIDPIGAICMLLFHFGWAKPVPVDLRKLKRPRRDFAIVAVAGPLSNLILAFVTSLFVVLAYNFAITTTPGNEFTKNLITVGYNFLYIFLVMNIGIAIFNLIPLPPLDGSRILGLILPPKLYYKILKHERTIYLIFITWLLLGSAVSRFLLSIPIISKNPTLSSVIEWLSLSGFLGNIIDFISNGFIAFWNLIFRF